MRLKFRKDSSENGFTGYVATDGSNPTFYRGQYWKLTLVKNENKNSWYSYAKTYGIAEIDQCKKYKS